MGNNAKNVDQCNTLRPNRSRQQLGGVLKAHIGCHIQAKSREYRHRQLPCDWTIKRMRWEIVARLRTAWFYLKARVCMCSLECNSSSAKLKRQVMARVINPQNRRPQRSNSNVSNSPAGSSVEQAREKDTNTELGSSLREYTWPSKAITVKDLESTESTSVTSSPYATYLMH